MFIPQWNLLQPDADEHLAFIPNLFTFFQIWRLSLGVKRSLIISNQSDIIKRKTEKHTGHFYYQIHKQTFLCRICPFWNFLWQWLKRPNKSTTLFNSTKLAKLFLSLFQLNNLVLVFCQSFSPSSLLTLRCTHLLVWNLN